jgi:hypothetical protein
MRDRQLVAGGATIHVSIVQDQILDMDKFARYPHRASRIEEMAALGKALADSRALGSFIQPSQRIFGRDNRRKQALQHRTIDFIAHC